MSPFLETPAAKPKEEVIRLDVSHLVTEDDTPVDNPFCEKQMRLLTHPLYASWKPGKPFVVMSNVGLYFALNSPPLVPDTLVSIDVEPPADLKPKEHRAYFTWLYGKAPDIVIEIVSNREGGELDRKKRGYAFHGVPYYVVFDPELMIQKKMLRCFKLRRAGTKTTYAEMSAQVFPGTGLGLVEWDGEFENQNDHWIRWVDDAGVLVPTGEEQAIESNLKAESASRRAENETRRAENETRRADEEARRSRLLAMKLQALGIDPATVIEE